MAVGKFVIATTTLSVNGVDLSTDAQSISIEGTADEVDVSSMGGSFREFLLGLKDVTCTVNWFQNFNAGRVDATLFPLWGSSTSFVVETKPTSAAVGPTNPIYRMTAAIMPNFAPLSGAVGEASQTETVFRNAPGGVLSRLTA